jgi:hypothetical protein
MRLAALTKNTAVLFETLMAMMGRVLEALYRAGSEWRDKFDGADWWRGGAGCYPMGEEHVVEERR